MADALRSLRWPGAPDPGRICAACQHYRAPGHFARLLLCAAPTCTALPVRGITLDLVTGRSTLNAPPSCREARGGVGGCGPDGRYFEPRHA